MLVLSNMHGVYGCMHMEHVLELALHYSSRLIEYSLNGSLLVLIAVNVNSCDNANAAM